MKRNHTWSLTMLLLFASPALAQQEIPKVSDPRLVVELVAQAPDIVHPISCDFDHKGRLLVIESHTHFAPKDYQGPKLDRILAFDVSKGGKPTTFFEGTRHTMDLAVHPDGSVYLATRNEILRLSPDGKEKTRIVFLDTKGDYPHNGLSGLCFDSKGDLYFGMGENSGKDLKLIGSDGTTYTDEQGGHIFHCTADGKKLRRVATGFWNPFGICRDIYGRTFCVDNDPDQSPPCRMVHVVEGGDYGFRYNYGRSGKHVFQSWHGELPGTLPMMTGVGEAPCEILSYESDGLPAEYLGKLMVTSWADHRVELYKVKPHGASFKAERAPFIQGGNNFRPVGLCVAPDGSLYVTDWVLPNYTLHGKGAIWHIRWKDAPKVERPDDPKKAIFSMHRPLREAAARKLAGGEKGRDFLRGCVDDAEPRVRAAAFQALVDATREVDAKWMAKLSQLAKRDAEPAIRALAIRELVRWQWLAPQDVDAKQPATVRVEAIRGLPDDDDATMLALVTDADPFLRHAAIESLSWGGYAILEEGGLLPKNRVSAKQRLASLLVFRRVFSAEADRDILRKRLLAFKNIPNRPDVFAREFIRDRDEEVRFLAAKWIADEKLVECRKDVETAMADPKISVRMYMACATALARIDGKEVSEKSLADYFAKRLADDATPVAQRAMLLRQVPATHKALTVELLTKLLKSDDAALKMEAVRALVEHPSAKRAGPLLDVFRNPRLDLPLRAYATLGLGADAENDLRAVAKDEGSPLRADALRALNVNRVIEKDRPPAKDLDAWLKRLEGKADADAGARIFAHPKLGGCAKCHRIDGRGADVGPDLSNIGNTDRRHILESILQPSANVAPHYVAWHLETADGKVRSGMLIDTNLDTYTYLDAKGERFKLKTGDLVEQRPTAISIMPEGLADTMTDQEMRDLLAYLQSRK